MKNKIWLLICTFTAVAISILTTGCEVQITQGFLEESGFIRIPADTPARLDYLKSLTQHTLVLHERNGEPYYVYSDISSCKCLYVGDEEAFQNYRRIMERISYLEETIPEPRSIDPEMDWEMWGPLVPDRTD